MDTLLQLNDKWGLQLNENEVGPSTPPTHPPSSFSFSHQELSVVLAHEQVRDLRACMANAVLSYARVDELPDPQLPVAYPRTPGHRPAPEDNPYNAWCDCVKRQTT